MFSQCMDFSNNQDKRQDERIIIYDQKSIFYIIFVQCKYPLPMRDSPLLAVSAATDDNDC